MSGSRQERQLQRRREALERVMNALEGAEGQGLPPELRTDLVRLGTGPEEIFFHDHGDFLQGLGELLERQGLLEACLALARHMEEDREHWLRRLACVEALPALRDRRALLDREYRRLLAAHFRRWGAADPQGEREAAFSAALVLEVLRSAERLWLQGNGRPMLPVLVHEGIAQLWPALYGHLRRTKGGRA